MKIWLGLVEPFKSYRGNRQKEKKKKTWTRLKTIPSILFQVVKKKDFDNSDGTNKQNTDFANRYLRILCRYLFAKSMYLWLFVLSLLL